MLHLLIDCVVKGDGKTWDQPNQQLLQQLSLYRVPAAFVYILPTTCLDASALPTRRPARVFMPAMRTPFTVATASVSSIAPPVCIDCCPTANLRTLDLALLDLSFVRFPLAGLGLWSLHLCHSTATSSWRLSNTSVDRPS